MMTIQRKELIGMYKELWIDVATLCNIHDKIHDSIWLAYKLHLPVHKKTAPKFEEDTSEFHKKLAYE